MTDEPFYAPNLKRAPLSVGQPGEKLFELLVGHDRYLSELRDHGEVYGVECQILKNEELLIVQRFDPRLDLSRPSRELAIQWAEEQRKGLERGCVPHVFKRAWVFLVVFVLQAGELLAKRIIGYVPPPYFERMVRAFIGLAPLSALLAGLSVLVLARFEPDSPRAVRSRFVSRIVLLTLVASAVAALDSLNDELWNPAFWGSPFLALIPLEGLLLLVARIALWKRLALGVGLTLPTWFGVMLGGLPWQVWGLEHGLPTSW